MNQRVLIYTRFHVGQAGTDPELVFDLRQAVESRGDEVVGKFVDDLEITGRGKYAGWNSLIRRLDEVDQVIVATAGDLPGKSVQDLLKVLGIFRDHGVTLCFHRERIDTATGSSSTLLEVVETYRRAKLSAAIREGQAKARAAGKRIGRPKIPPKILTQIQASLAEGSTGVRAIARKLNVSPASVINARLSMTAYSDAS